MTNNPALAPEANDPQRRAHQRDHLRRTPRHHAAAGLPGLQLDPRRLRRCDHGFGNDRRRRRHGGPGPPRSDGDAALLRLQHGRLLPPLAQDAQAAQEPAQDFSCELVPQEQGRQVPLAGLWREHARAQMDRRPLPRPRPGLRNAGRLDARAAATSIRKDSRIAPTSN